MNRTQSYLEKVRKKHGGATDYRLGKILEIPRARIHDYTKGTMQADSYAAARMALELDLDPLEVIADIEAESARTETKRGFWKSFLSGLTQTTLGGVLLLTGSITMPGQPGTADPPGSSHNGKFRKTEKPRKGLFSWLVEGISSASGGSLV